MWKQVIFWIAVIMLIDAIIGLIGLPFWQRKMPSINIQKWAMVESIIALCIIIVYFLFW